MGAKFQPLVEKYSAQVKTADIGPSTELILIFHWADKEGKVVHTAREHMEPTMKVQGVGSGDKARGFASTLHVGTILDNLKRRMLDAPDGDIDRNVKPSPIYLHDITLEIIQP